jgi:hypothetical protein
LKSAIVGKVNYNLVVDDFAQSVNVGVRL